MLRYIFAFFFIALVFPTMGQIDQQVFWIHGLNDNQTCWDIYEEQFQAEKRLTSNNSQYNSDLGVVGGAQDLFPNINRANVVIGHSMGGLIARQAFRQGNTFDRYISFGTPHYGARIVNAVENGDLRNFTVDAIYEMTRGINVGVSVALEATKIVLNIAGVKTDINITKAGISLLYDMVEDDLTNRFMGQGGNFIAENAPEIQALSEYNMNISDIAVYGVEQAPVFARFAMGSTLNESMYSTMHYSQFDRAPDEKAVLLQETILSIYDAATVFCSGTAVYFGAATFFTFGATAPLAIFWGYAAYEWNQGARFLRYQIDTKWHFLIGASRYETITYDYKVYQCEQVWEKELDDLPSKKERYEENCYYVTKQKTESVLINEETDGLLNKSTQIGLIGRDRVLSCENTNHFELRNNFESERLIRQIFNGDWGGDFRITDR